MKNSMHRLIPLLILACAVASAAEPRFTGSAGLTDGPEAGGVISADGRYNLNAGLQPDTAMHGNSRFGFSAKLHPDPASVAASCGPVTDRIFRNGFE